jgi:hypothetical protein
LEEPAEGCGVATVTGLEAVGEVCVAVFTTPVAEPPTLLDVLVVWSRWTVTLGELAVDLRVEAWV